MTLPQIVSPSVTKLNLDGNQIESITFQSHPKLKSLSLNKNKLTSGEGLKFHKQLEELSIQDNETLTNLRGLKGFPKLKKLNLSGCKIESLDEFPRLPALEELIFDRNPLASLDEIPKINHLTSLKKLSMIESPLAEEKGDDLRSEILIALTDKIEGFKEINGEPVDEEQLKAAKETRDQRIADEIERKKQEEDARKEAEAAAKAEAEGEGA